jgi:hypothetical protein
MMMMMMMTLVMWTSTRRMLDDTSSIACHIDRTNMSSLPIARHIYRTTLHMLLDT